MPIETLDPRLRQLGRIRTGVQVPDERRPGETRPSGLQTFRLTSSDASLIGSAASIYGGIPSLWRPGEWEVVTNATELEIVLPPKGAISQWFELWTAGGCTRRCDGITEQLTSRPCLCPADPEERRIAATSRPPAACRPTTRLSVMLPRVPDVGIWMLETRGYYAATELAGAVGMLEAAGAAGRFVPARLALDHRTRKTPSGTRHYLVPVVRFTGTVDAGLALAAGAPLLELPSGEPSRGADDVLRLTRDELVDRLNAEGFPLAWAIERARELYGRTDLEPRERGALLELLRAEASA